MMGKAEIVARGPGDGSHASFRSRVLSIVSGIPPGRVATYGDVAAAAGHPRAGRAVGNVMRECRLGAVPCHRVVQAGGLLGGYGGREWRKRELLVREGVNVARGRIEHFTALRLPVAALARAGRRDRR